jgi:hypothetical protein
MRSNEQVANISHLLGQIFYLPEFKLGYAARINFHRSRTLFIEGYE